MVVLLETHKALCSDLALLLCGSKRFNIHGR